MDMVSAELAHLNNQSIAVNTSSSASSSSSSYRPPPSAISQTHRPTTHPPPMRPYNIPSTNGHSYPLPPSSTMLPRVQKPPKPKKNEKSTIYQNRDKNAKRRDPDDSDSAEEVSDGESVNSWSGDEGRRKKRRRGDEPEVDAEGEALAAFNKAETEVLTGTIGEFMKFDWVRNLQLTV